MESLIIQQTEFTPQVILDTKTLKFEISGESRPENSGKFYEPIIKWLEQYEAILFWQKNNFTTPTPTIFEFKFEYFNSTSAKYIMDILNLLNKYHTNGFNTQIKWYYDYLDTDMKESGEELATLVKVPFEFKPVTD